MPKHVIRKELLARRKHLPDSVCRDLSLKAQQRIIDSECFKAAQTIALYSPINNEVQTALLFSIALAAGKQVCYPRIESGRLEFVEVVAGQDLQPGTFGVAEPRSGRLLLFAAVDLIVVPGVAFDRTGHRLGYGKGFYDRELAQVSVAATTVGLCFDFQLCESLPCESHDQPVQFLSTETEFISCHREVSGSP